ncbi:MAG: hypothetical protein RSB41_02590 [Bacilli bacterium]
MNVKNNNYQQLIYQYNLSVIESMCSSEEFIHIKNCYDREICSLVRGNDSEYLIGDYYGCALSLIQEIIFRGENKCISELYFFDEEVYLYLNYNKISSEVKTTKKRVSSFTGDIISPGSPIIKYRPIIFNKSRNKCYKLIAGTLFVEPYYQDMLPNNIVELEALKLKLEISQRLHFSDFGEEKIENIDYYDMTTRVGTLELEPLRKRYK